MRALCSRQTRWYGCGLRLGLLLRWAPGADYATQGKPAVATYCRVHGVSGWSLGGKWRAYRLLDAMWCGRWFSGMVVDLEDEDAISAGKELGPR